MTLDSPVPPPTASRRFPLWGASLAVFLAPLVIYARTVFHAYGFRDDYPLLRETYEEPGKILAVCSSQGRIIYGWILEHANHWAGDVAGLRWIRLGGALGLALLALWVLRLAVQAGWPLRYSAGFALLLVFSPPAQVLVSWSICSPQVIALLLGTAAFAMAEWKRGPGWVAAATLLMAVGALTYPPNALFYVVLMALVLVQRHRDTWQEAYRWAARHLFIAFGGLTASFVLLQVAFAQHWFRRSHRIRFETKWFSKLGWMLREVMPDALAPPFLDGAKGISAAPYWTMVVLALLLVAAGTALEGKRFGKEGLIRWVTGMVVLSLAAYCVSLVAGERWPSYRSAFALTGVWTVFLIAALMNVSRALPALTERLPSLLFTGWVLLSVALSYRHSYELFAVPQGRELKLLEAGAEQARHFAMPRIFVVSANQNDSWTWHRYGDEFGSVTVDAPWLAMEVIHVLMRRRGSTAGRRRYDLQSGRESPAPGSFDVLVDLRTLRTARP